MPGLLAAIAIVVGIVVGAITTGFGAWFVGIPIMLLGLGVAGMLEVMRRRQQATDIKRFRDSAQAQKTDFSEQDRRTQYTPSDRDAD